MVRRFATDSLTPSEEEIAVRAYYIWEAAGCPHGQAAAHWQKAEQQLTAIHKQEEHALRHWEKAKGFNRKRRR